MRFTVLLNIALIFPSWKTVSVACTAHPLYTVYKVLCQSIDTYISMSFSDLR